MALMRIALPISVPSTGVSARQGFHTDLYMTSVQDAAEIFVGRLVEDYR